MSIQVIAGTTGALGFGMLFGLRPKYLPIAALGGFLCWAVYLVGITFIWEGVFWPTVLSAAVTSLFSEIIGKIYHIPASAIYTPAVVPLVPGASLYYTMNAIVANDWIKAQYMAVETVKYTLGIAIGMSAVYTIFAIKKRIQLKGSRYE